MDDHTFDSRRVLTLDSACEHQDDLLIATSDLERLGTLLEESFASLQNGLLDTLSRLHDWHRTGRLAESAYLLAIEELNEALAALQCQDMASQLINHTTIRLRRSAQRLSSEAFVDDEEEESADVDTGPLRLNPVAQLGIEPGSVELF
jgi:hypothetical protein